MADFKYKKSFEFNDSHKAFRPPKPCSSQLLARKYDRAAYDSHRDRVKSSKPSIDNSPPKRYMHLEVKLKKMQMEEERAAQIEHDNRLLLAKMSKIMRTSGAIDNRNLVEFKSLDREKRQSELVAIARENQAMLKRIQARQPNLTAASQEAAFTEHLRFSNQVTTHPDKTMLYTGSQSDFEAAESVAESQDLAQQEEPLTEDPEAETATYKSDDEAAEEL